MLIHIVKSDEEIRALFKEVNSSVLVPDQLYFFHSDLISLGPGVTIQRFSGKGDTDACKRSCPAFFN